MFVPNNETMFSMRDLYPAYGGIDTSTLAVPESDDLEALNEDTKVAENVGIKEAKSKNIILAIGVIFALIVFLGGN